MSSKVLDRAMEEINRLKEEIDALKKDEQPKEKSTWDVIPKNVSRLDSILADRDAAMERYSNKLFRRKDAKQKQK